MNITTIQRPCYVTTDGTEFAQEADARRYQAVLDVKDQLDEYVTGVTETPAHQARLRSAITDFVKWQAARAA